MHKLFFFCSLLATLSIQCTPIQIHILNQINTKICFRSQFYSMACRLRGGSEFSLDNLEELVKRKELTGAVNLQRYTPEQYREMGIDGAYYDSEGRINFAPPGFHSWKRCLKAM